MVGNYMNDSRKQASGFKLQSLSRMAGVKDEHNISFLHHVEKVIRSAFPQLENFMEDIKAVKDAAISTTPLTIANIVSVLDLERECGEFIESVQIVQRSCDTGVLSDPDVFHPEDKALKLVLSFLNEARNKAKNLSGLFEATIKTEFDGVMRYFGEDPLDKSSRSGFFRRFADFMVQYQNAKKENMVREEVKKKEEARKKVLGTAKPTGGTRDARTVEANNKIMDDLLNKLRDAPKDSGRHQRRRAARRNVSGGVRALPTRSISITSEVVESEKGSPGRESPSPVPTVAVTAPAGVEDGEEVDLGKVAQGLLAGLKGGDDLLASFREARKSVNEGMKTEEVKVEESPQSPTEGASLLAEMLAPTND
jgi:cytokinesis protein